MECDRKCKNATCCKTLQVNLYWLDFLNYDYDFTEDDNGNCHLLKKEDGSCIYLNNNICSIYKDRPLDCKSYYCK